MNNRLHIFILVFLGLLLLFGCVSTPQADGDNKTSTNDSTNGKTENTSSMADEPFINNTVDLNEKCCQECLSASQQDPRGFDISIAPCSDYDGYPNPDLQLSKECADYFKENQITLVECRS